jgi:ABC-type multidrug transport system ATPase subunit
MVNLDPARIFVCDEAESPELVQEEIHARARRPHDPTAGLDPASEHAIIGALDALMTGRTSVVIAHHLATIRRADIIFVIKDSALVEQGTHDALMAQNGVYTEMQRIQAPEDATITTAQPAA